MLFNFPWGVKVDASQVTSGIFTISRIPATAIERMVSVVDEAERFLLTTDTVQNGDTVLQINPNNKMYRVVDDTKLHEEAGYQVYSGAPYWQNIQDRPVDVLEGKTLSVTEDTTLAGGSHSGTNTGDNPGVTEVEGVTPVASSGGDTPAISLVNNAEIPETVNAVDIGALADSDTVIPTSKAVKTVTDGKVDKVPSEANLIGNYALLGITTNSKIDFGESVISEVGTYLYPTGYDFTYSGNMKLGTTAVSGTWRCMGYIPATDSATIKVSLFLRIA